MSVEIHLTPHVDASYFDGSWHLFDYEHGWVSDEAWQKLPDAREAFEHAEVHWVLG